MTLGRFVGLLFSLFLMYGMYIGVTGVMVVIYTLLTIGSFLVLGLHLLSKDVFQEIAKQTRLTLTPLSWFTGLMTTSLWVWVGLIVENTTFLYFYTLAAVISYSWSIRVYCTKLS